MRTDTTDTNDDMYKRQSRATWLTVLVIFTLISVGYAIYAPYYRGDAYIKNSTTDTTTLNQRSK